MTTERVFFLKFNRNKIENFIKFDGHFSVSYDRRIYFDSILGIHKWKWEFDNEDQKILLLLVFNIFL